MAKLDWFNDDMTAYAKPLTSKYEALQAARKAQAEAIAKLPETAALNAARDTFEANWLADVESGKLTFGGKRLAVPSDMEVTHGYNFGKHSFALRTKRRERTASAALSPFLK